MASNHSGKLSKPCAITNTGTGVWVVGCQMRVRSVRLGAPLNIELGGVGRVVSTHVRSLRVTAPVPELVAGTVLSPHAANVAPISTTTALHRNSVWRSSD